MIVDSTNPRVMADNIRELAANSGGGSDLPEVTADDDGKVLGVVEGSWGKMDIPSEIVDYSTTEQDTGSKWIDGRPVYQKTYVFETPQTLSIGWTSVITKGESEAAIDTIIKGFVITTDGIYFPVGIACNDETSIEANNVASITINNVKYFTIQYLKTAPTKSAKRKTTKGEN